MKNLLHKYGLLLGIEIIALISIFSCGGEKSQKDWILINDPAVFTKKLECGENQILYTNNSKKMEKLNFTFHNKCEFSAYTWVGQSDSTLTGGTQLTIPGRHSIKSSCELNPGESFFGECSLVSTIENKGCEIDYKIVATK